jgi:hypothetical protein
LAPGLQELGRFRLFETDPVFLRRSSTAISVARYSSWILTDWLITISTYIAILTLQMALSREIEDCFTSMETNSRAFQGYQSQGFGVGTMDATTPVFDARLRQTR